MFGGWLSYTQAAQQLEILHSEPAMYCAVLATEVASLDTGEVIYRRNHNKLLVPASTLKLLTTIAALEKLGDETRFVTDLGSSGGVRDGTLEGNLVIRGGGDPTSGLRICGPCLQVGPMHCAPREYAAFVGISSATKVCLEQPSMARGGCGMTWLGISVCTD
ncbi:MAG: D-alanyl-D-alanine carboxypeptidase [Myxococcota bacterium]